MATARTFIRSIHLGRIVPELECNIAKEITDNNLNPKLLRTRRNVGFIGLPTLLEFAAQKKIRQVSDSHFRKEVKRLSTVLHKLKLPDDKETIKLKKADAKTQLEVRDKIGNRSHLDRTELVFNEERDMAQFELSRLIEGSIEDRRRDWHYYEYDDYASNLYMATRLAPNYACLETVMREICLCLPDFKPESVLDFGSGLGTTTWAVKQTWPDSVREFMNIDISKDQQDLCEYLLRSGKEHGEQIPDLFQKQYLSSSNRTKYDMVVAAFSMLELPNAEARTQTIENLWSKTNDLLVLIERGNKGGFTIINEARHLILDLSGHDVTKKINYTLDSRLDCGRKLPQAYVLAPCPHEFACPRAQMTSKKLMDICRFRVYYEPLDVGERKRPILHEDFSYVVLRKGPHPSYSSQTEPRWPRIVEKRHKSSGQITHHLCCANGNLAETIVTKGRYGKATYQVAKSCDWGDIFPVRVKDTYSKRSFIDEKNACDSDKNLEQDINGISKV